MEAVPGVYHESVDAARPLICMDEASRQILSDAVAPLPMKPATPGRPGTPERVDDKYERHGVRALLVFYNPVDGWTSASSVEPRRVGCRESRTRRDGADEVRRLADADYPAAETVTLVCDGSTELAEVNLNTHDEASLYHAFDAGTAGRLRRRLRLGHGPRRGRRRVGGRPQRPPPRHRLAVHDGGRPNQAQEPVS